MCEFCTPRSLGDLPEDTHSTSEDDAGAYENARVRFHLGRRADLLERAEQDGFDRSAEES